MGNGLVMKQRLAADTLFSLLVCCAIAAAVYDCNVPRSLFISTYVNERIHLEPVLSFLGGVVAVAILVGVCHVWQIKFRYALAIWVLGMVFGHLFWSQPPIFNHQDMPDYTAQQSDYTDKP